MRGKYLITMDDCGRLLAYCNDGHLHPLFTVREPLWGDCPIQRGETINGVPAAYRFRGDECVMSDCLPANIVDIYYVDELPKSFAECGGK